MHVPCELSALIAGNRRSAAGAILPTGRCVLSAPVDASGRIFFTFTIETIQQMK